MSIATLWPLFVLVPGLLFHVVYLVVRKPVWSWLLVLGGSLTVWGVVFFLNTFGGWDSMSYLWPLLLLGPVLGFWEMYLFGLRHRYLLGFNLLLTILSLAFGGGYSLFGMKGLNAVSDVWDVLAGGLLVAIGTAALFGKFFAPKGQQR